MLMTTDSVIILLNRNRISLVENTRYIKLYCGPLAPKMILCLLCLTPFAFLDYIMGFYIRGQGVYIYIWPSDYI